MTAKFFNLETEKNVQKTIPKSQSLKSALFCLRNAWRLGCLLLGSWNVKGKGQVSMLKKQTAYRLSVMKTIDEKEKMISQRKRGRGKRKKVY